VRVTFRQKLKVSLHLLQKDNVGEFHDQADNELIVIRGPLRIIMIPSGCQ
jgi:hypothetical protein